MKVIGFIGVKSSLFDNSYFICLPFYLCGIYVCSVKSFDNGSIDSFIDFTILKVSTMGEC